MGKITIGEITIADVDQFLADRQANKPYEYKGTLTEVPPKGEEKPQEIGARECSQCNRIGPHYLNDYICVSCRDNG